MPPGAAKGRRQGWAHRPRLPLRPPSKALNKHCPETDMHSAPWTKLSSWMGQAWWNLLNLLQGHLPGEHGPLRPQVPQQLHPRQGVEAHLGGSVQGQAGAPAAAAKRTAPCPAPARRPPAGCINIPQIPTPGGAPSPSARCSLSRGPARPGRGRNRTASASCSREKFWALARAPKAGPPRYTASAPAYTAAPQGLGTACGGQYFKVLFPSFLLKKADKAILFKFLIVAQGVLPPVVGLGVVPGLVFLGQSRLPQARFAPAPAAPVGGLGPGLVHPGAWPPPRRALAAATVDCFSCSAFWSWASFSSAASFRAALSAASFFQLLQQALVLRGGHAPGAGRWFSSRSCSSSWRRGSS